MSDQENTEKKVIKKAVKKKKAQAGSVTAASMNSIKSILDEMKIDRESRDRQFESLAEGIREGLNLMSEQAESRDSRRDKEMLQLFDGLNAAFTRVNSISGERDDRNAMIINQLMESIKYEHEATLSEVHEQDALTEKKMDYLSQLHEQRSRRNKWIAIPGIALGVIAVIYMFYVVTVMETAMTSMSKDMAKMTATVNNMNTNVGVLTRDMNVMTHNTVPVMNGMRNVMPWSR